MKMPQEEKIGGVEKSRMIWQHNAMLRGRIAMAVSAAAAVLSSPTATKEAKSAALELQKTADRLRGLLIDRDNSIFREDKK